MTPEEQLDKWVAGESVHDHENDQCCPDFSCCKPELLVSIGEREIFQELFLAGNESEINSMLMGFLGRSIELMFKSEPRVHIIGEHEMPSVPE